MAGLCHGLQSPPPPAPPRPLPTQKRGLTSFGVYSLRVWAEGGLGRGESRWVKAGGGGCVGRGMPRSGNAKGMRPATPKVR